MQEISEPKRRIYRWYVEPFGDGVNASIASLVSVEQDGLIGKPDNRGIKHDVYVITFGKLRALLNSRWRLGSDFDAFSEEGNGLMYNKNNFLRLIMKSKRARVIRPAAAA